MSSHELSGAAMLAALPPPLRQDPSVAALAQAVADVLDRRRAEIDSVSLYARIDSLPEALLDILAYDFKVDWWDPNYSVEEKRRTLKDSWRVHRMLGTKGAVEMAIAAIYPGTAVEEWFQYGGEPYHFKLTIDFTGEPDDPDRRERVMRRLDFYKNLRSHADRVEFRSTAETAEGKAVYVPSAASFSESPLPEWRQDYEFRDTVQAVPSTAAISVSPMPEWRMDYAMRGTLRAVPAASAISVTELPEWQMDYSMAGHAGLAGGFWAISTTTLPPYEG